MATAASAAKEFNDGPAVPEAVKRLLEAFPLAKLCEALGNAQPSDREVLVTTLERLADFDEVCSGFLGNDTVAVFLRQGARSGDPRLVKLTARLLERLASSDAGATVLVGTGLVEDLELLLLAEDVGTAEAAARSICKASAWSASRDAVLGANGLAQSLLSRLPSLRETQQIRILSLFVELGRSSETDAFPALAACGAFKRVLDAFLTDDLLLKLNGVELMDALGSYQAGQEFLCQQGVPEKLAADLSDPCCDDSVRLCVARLLGCILLRDPTTMGALLPTQRSPFAQVLAAFLESQNPTERLCAIQAFGNIAVHKSGLEFFIQWPDFLRSVVSTVSASQNEVSTMAMSAWTHLLSGRPHKDATAAPDADIWKIAEEQILPSTLKNLSQKPFPDVRCFTWRLLAVLATSQDAARKMLVSDGIREKLLDFSSETASDPKIAKHEFVQALVKHQGTWLAAFLDENIDMMLTEYAKQGAFWMPQVSTVNLADQAM